MPPLPGQAPEPPLPGQGPTVGGSTRSTSAPPTGSGGGISGAGAIAGGLLAIAAIAFVLSLESRRATRARREREPDEAGLETEEAAPEEPGDADPGAADPPEPTG